MRAPLQPLDLSLVNALQGGFPLEPRPFARIAAGLGAHEDEVIERVRFLVSEGYLSRFGPLYDAQGMGGSVCLAALAVPAERFEEVTALVNAHPEVAHNYERDHTFNMWFVLSSEKPGRIVDVAHEIEAETGLAVHMMPKLREFFIGFRVEV